MRDFTATYMKGSSSWYTSNGGRMTEKARCYLFDRARSRGLMVVI